MYKSIPLRTHVASALLCLTLFASCSTDDYTTLPDGKYPMAFITAMEGLTQTRATTVNTWAGNEKIAVQVGGEVKEYKPASSNLSMLTGSDADNTFYWQKADETKIVGAWYCGDGSTAAGQANATQLPTRWTVQTDQSGEGYAASDILYAMPLNIAYADRDSKQLTFKHLPAKVVINLTYGKGLTEENVQSATVSIVNHAITSGEIDKSAGTMAQITTPGSEEISTNVLAAPEVNFQKSVQAIVVPQQVPTGTKFIKVTIGKGTAARDYYYTTKTDTEVNLECGKQYTYNITVTKGEELVVTDKTTVTWQEGTATSTPVTPATSFYITCPRANEVNDFTISDATLLSGDKYTVNPNTTITISYTTTFKRSGYNLVQGIAKVSTPIYENGTFKITVSDIRGDLVFSFEEYLFAEVGDYYYANGTWSPDYISDSGSPACIGVVFWVGSEAFDKDPLLQLHHPGCTHGLVVALQDAGGKMNWSMQYESVKNWVINTYNSGVDLGETNKMCGYSNTLALMAYNSEKGSGNGFRVLPCDAILDYSNNNPAPTNSSGWYFPSVMELKYVLWGQNQVKGTAGRDYLNTQIGIVSGGSQIVSEPYWPSTEYSDQSDHAWVVYFNSDVVSLSHKTSPFRVRPILAF